MRLGLMSDVCGLMTNCTWPDSGYVGAMPKRSDLRITKRTVDALRVENEDAVFWDRDLPGFGVRVHATGRKVYVVQSRGPSGLKRVSLGRHGDLSAEEARKQAAGVIDRIKRGEEPFPTSPVSELTVAGLAERYLRVHVAVHCKPKTAQLCRSVLDRHILPALGHKEVGAVGREDVAELHNRLRGTPYMANTAVGILSKMYRLAETWDLAPAGRNPCRSVRNYRERSRERFLTPEEFRRLGRALREAEAESASWLPVIAAIHLLLLTGCRKGEILTLRWDDVDRTTGELRLRDAKSGPRMVPLTAPVIKVLDGIPRGEDNPWVIPGRKPGAHLPDLAYYWGRIAARAGLYGVRIHDVRHSYASRALALGESLSVIGRLLGHAKVGTTARYAHLVRNAEKEAAGRVGDSIGVHIAPNDDAPDAEAA